jgi:hypothetical protein
MSAFKYDDKDLLKRTIDALLRPAASHNTLALSKDDVRSLISGRQNYCEPSWPYDILWSHPRVMEVTKGMGVTLKFRDQWGSSWTSTHDPDFADKITSWVITHRDHVYRKALCQLAIDKLDALCNTQAQVRFLWPTILLLAKHGGEALEPMARRLQEFRQPRDVPGLPVGLRDLLREATAIITMNALYDGGPKERWEGEVKIECTHWFKFEAHGYEFGGQ